MFTNKDENLEGTKLHGCSNISNQGSFVSLSKKKDVALFSKHHERIVLKKSPQKSFD